MKAATGSDLVFSLALALLFMALCAVLAQPLIADRIPGESPALAAFKGMTRLAAFPPNAK